MHSHHGRILNELPVFRRWGWFKASTFYFSYGPMFSILTLVPWQLNLIFPSSRTTPFHTSLGMAGLEGHHIGMDRRERLHSMEPYELECLVNIYLQSRVDCGLLSFCSYRAQNAPRLPSIRYSVTIIVTTTYFSSAYLLT